MHDRVCRALHEQDLWEAVGLDPAGPDRLWTRFEDCDPRMGGLQVVALWSLGEFLQRHQLTVA